MSARATPKDTKWHKIMEYIYRRRSGGPVYAAELQGVAVAAFQSDPSTVTARLRELSASGFVYQARGRRTAGSKLLTYYVCCADQWHRWTHGGPEALKAYLREKKQKRGCARADRAAPSGAAGVEVGTGSPLPPTRAPAAQLTLGDAGEPKRRWQR
jgi:hypothetical protein